MTDTIPEPPATIEEARATKLEVEKRISEILRNYQRLHGVRITSIDAVLFSSAQLGEHLSSVALTVEI